MDTKLFLVLSATYEYTREPAPHENDAERRLRLYIKGGVEGYMREQGYTYDDTKHEWIGEKRGYHANVTRL